MRNCTPPPFILTCFVCFLCGVLFSSCIPTTHTRIVENFNSGWKFSLEDTSEAHTIDLNDDDWRILDLPHDWSIEGSFDKNNPAGVGGGALPGGIGWYRKHFVISQDDLTKKIFIEFDGVYQNSEVWVNGQFVGKRPNGYISFRYDISSVIKEGENVIAVKADNSQQPNSRWYSGSGIYRNVRLLKTDPVYVDHWGTYITTPEATAHVATVHIETIVRNATPTDHDVTLETVLYDAEGKSVVTSTETKRISKDAQHKFNHTLKVPDPNVWSTGNPYLYKAISLVKYNGETADTYETTFGIRTFSFDATKGFFLNGIQQKIRGVCMHHDLGCLGAAINERAIERQLEILKAMGVNAIRTAHNPPAPELLSLCDRMGFIVMDEAFDMWKKKKSEFDYSMYWDEWHRQDLEDLIRRDRNHPSVIIWSIGNEIGEQWDSTGTAITHELAHIVKKLDPTRPITTGNNEINNNSIINSGALDLIGYNYNHKDYAEFHTRYPGRKFIATETTSALATRDHYDMPSDSIRRWPISWDKLFTQGNPDNTVSAYDNVSTPWGSTHEETWKVMKKHDHLSGMFIWTGFDYLGEPTPYTWPSRSSYFGVVDLAGFPKDAYYMYQSEWSDKTVLHVFPHWNWLPGQEIDLWVYYNNAAEVELFINGISKGVKRKEGEDLHVMWRVNFEQGIARVVSRKDGKEVLTREIKTAERPAKIILEADRKFIKADGRDLSFLTIKVVDGNGVLVPYADDLITFELQGKAFIAGVDNGDPTSHTSFKAHSIKAFHGKCLAVIRSQNEASEIKLTATAPGLESAELIIKSR